MACVPRFMNSLQNVNNAPRHHSTTIYTRWPKFLLPFYSFWLCFTRKKVLILFSFPRINTTVLPKSRNYHSKDNKFTICFYDWFQQLGNTRYVAYFAPLGSLLIGRFSHRYLMTQRGRTSPAILDDSALRFHNNSSVHYVDHGDKINRDVSGWIDTLITYFHNLL